MTFFEQKAKAELDGMAVTGKTTKADIEAFYADKPVEEVKEVIVERIVEVAPKCNHNYEFTTMQAIRDTQPLDDNGKPYRTQEGKPILGRRLYKDRFVCSLCGKVELRDSVK